jgi:HSP20 family protein
MVEKTDVTPQPHEFWNQLLGPVRHLGQQVANLFAPSSEAAGTDDAYEITVELPGVKDADIHLEVDERRITVSGEKQSAREEKGKSYFFSERVYGAFSRTFRVPEDAAIDKIDATHRDGVLTIRIPRQPRDSGKRRIEVKSG